MSEAVRTIDDEPQEESESSSKQKSKQSDVAAAVAAAANESYGMTPLEDKLGRDLWVRTRMCFCSPESETDCRFHSQEEKGWEQCPVTETAKKNHKILGRWLWARNPRYGQAPTEEEMVEYQAKLAKEIPAVVTIQKPEHMPARILKGTTEGIEPVPYEYVRNVKSEEAIAVVASKIYGV